MGLANRFPSRSGADSTPVRLRPSIPRSLRHLPNRLIVAWKPEYLWNAAETGFLAQIAMFNSAAGCRVISETRSSPNDLRQVLEFRDRIDCCWKSFSFMSALVLSVMRSRTSFTSPKPQRLIRRFRKGRDTGISSAPER